MDERNVTGYQGWQEATKEATTIICGEELNESLIFDKEAGVDNEDQDIFLPIDDDELHVINAGGLNRSAASE